jgi:hypothetical protein
MISTDRRTQLLAPLTLLALCSASACSKSNNIDQSQRNSYLVDMNTSGVLPGPDGLQLELTVGSVATPVTIELDEAMPDEYPPIPSNQPIAGKVYSFTPHNQMFQHPVVIDLPAAGGTTAITAEPGGPWMPTNSALSGLFVQVQTDHFSYYAVAGGGTATIPDGGAKSDDGGSGGLFSDASAGRDSGTGGNMQCTQPMPGPTGTTSASGVLAHMQVPAGVPFTAVDGYAVYQQTAMPGGISTTYSTTLTITFTDFANACSTAIATGQDGMHPRGGSGTAGSKLFMVTLQTSSMMAKVDLQPMMTYGQGDPTWNSQFFFIGLDSTCNPQMAFTQPDSTTSIYVSAFDTTHIAGTITFAGQGTTDTFMGSFDFPICGLSSQPGASCCLAPTM